MLKLYPQEVTAQQLPLSKESRSLFSSSLAGNKFFFISLGCPRNLVDSEVMLGILLKAGYEPSKSLEEADYIVVNTCSFLEASRQEALATMREVEEKKKSGAKLIVTGCMVQSHAGEIEKTFPKIDYLLGSGDVGKILVAIQSKEQGKTITSARSFLQEGEVPRQLSTPSHYAYLKIAEGCRKRCSYCIIPKIKGPLKSKPIKQVLREFQVLRKSGVSEIILIAQDLGDFGKDMGFKKNKGLIALLEEILKEEGDFWLRFLYLYPDEIDDEMIALMKRDPRICPYLDLPIQHINNEILKAMHRKTSREEIISIITRLRKEIPGISIRTSLIVGFPGETEKEFEELVDFVKKYPLDQVGIFAYSREKESHSYSLPGQVEEEVKQKRRERLAKVQQAVLKKHLNDKIGQQLEVVVEGYHLESPLLMRGRHRGQCPEIDGEVIINDGRKVDAFGKKYQVEITDVSGYDLVGRVIKRLV